MKKTARIVLSIVLAFFGMALVGRAFDTMNLPIFHTWGLMHGSFIIVWPLFTLALYFIFGTVPLLREEKK